MRTKTGNIWLIGLIALVLVVGVAVGVRIGEREQAAYASFVEQPQGGSVPVGETYKAKWKTDYPVGRFEIYELVDGSDWTMIGYGNRNGATETSFPFVLDTAATKTYKITCYSSSVDPDTSEPYYSDTSDPFVIVWEEGEGLLTGSVVITGPTETFKYGQTLRAEVVGGNNTGDFRYQWKRYDVVIPGATAETYTLTEEDINKKNKSRGEKYGASR